MERMGCAPAMDRPSSALGYEENRAVNLTESVHDPLKPTLSALLFQNGLPDLPTLLIEPHRNHAGAWRIKFSYETVEPLSMAVDQASTMIRQLHELGEAELADEMDIAVKSATRYASM
jgi:hypothetical protein